MWCVTSDVRHDILSVWLGNRDGFDIRIWYQYSIPVFDISILENPTDLMYWNISFIVVSYQMQHQYTNILSNNLTIWTKNIIWVILILCRSNYCVRKDMFDADIVSSSVFRYIEKTTLKININDCTLSSSLLWTFCVWYDVMCSARCKTWHVACDVRHDM